MSIDVSIVNFEKKFANKVGHILYKNQRTNKLSGMFAF